MGTERLTVGYTARCETSGNIQESRLYPGLPGSVADGETREKASGARQSTGGYA